MQKVRKQKKMLAAKIDFNFKNKNNSFPSQYWCTISLYYFLGLEDGAPIFPAAFHQSGCTLKTNQIH